MLQYLSGHFSMLKFDRHETESFLFYVHYRVTFLMLMACCIVVTSNLYAGEPIVCTDTKHATAEVIATYCWSHSTYSIREAYNKTPGVDIPHPGVDASENEDDYIYRNYYQWVYLVLFVQAVFFYLPHGVWKCLEDGKMEQLCENVINTPPVHDNQDSEEEDEVMSRENQMNAAANFIFQRWGWYSKYALAYFFCEILSWLNVLFQTLALNSFFQGEFIPLGKRAIAYFRASHLYDNPLSWVFPRVARCHFHKIAPTGLIDTIDVLCVLPVNAISEKIYLMIWFWYLLLAIVSFIGIVKTVLTIAFPYVRGFRLSSSVVTLRFPKFRGTKKLARQVGRKSSFGDWFIMTILAKRMDIMDFKLLLLHLSDEISLASFQEKDTAIIDVKTESTAV